uniref:Uncharacterized protein n=1 Tax=Chromera velia CCMP2878 TaxID=1169474 RepID=A0A0G4HNX0_9ALVE|eukprot:Cvel_7674.t1-p1 / transcript=Cvel_7674.t1 / gene=Cvel_7674 / organism=Chromera_velia_CCMP2878 / gene_product=hypothetical protein / transcript_product=hypothetical protein / location=Cvel_scaffold407:53060-54673(-) / protein_length=538 / sequence_SO=supercontig / SO=protein_coding / is_pseudo=false
MRALGTVAPTMLGFLLLFVFMERCRSEMLSIRRSRVPVSFLQFSETTRDLSTGEETDDVPIVTVDAYNPAECEDADSAKLNILKRKGNDAVNKLEENFRNTYYRCESISKKYVDEATTKSVRTVSRVASVLGDTAAWVNIGIAIAGFAGVAAATGPVGAAVVLGIAVFGLCVGLAAMAYQYHVEHSDDFKTKKGELESYLGHLCPNLQGRAEAEIIRLRAFYDHTFSAANCADRSSISYRDIDVEFASKTQKGSLGEQFGVVFPGKVDKFFTVFDRVTNVAAAAFNGVGIGIAIADAGKVAAQMVMTWAAPVSDTIAWFAGEVGLTVCEAMRSGIDKLAEQRKAGAAAFHAMKAWIAEKSSGPEAIVSKERAEQFLSNAAVFWDQCGGSVTMVIKIGTEVDPDMKQCIIEKDNGFTRALLFQSTGGGLLTRKKGGHTEGLTNLKKGPVVSERAVAKVKSFVSKFRESAICNQPCSHCVDISAVPDRQRTSLLKHFASNKGEIIQKKTGGTCYMNSRWIPTPSSSTSGPEMDVDPDSLN